MLKVGLEVSAAAIAAMLSGPSWNRLLLRVLLLLLVLRGLLLRALSSVVGGVGRHAEGGGRSAKKGSFEYGTSLQKLKRC